MVGEARPDHRCGPHRNHGGSDQPEHVGALAACCHHGYERLPPGSRKNNGGTTGYVDTEKRTLPDLEGKNGI